MKIDCEDMKINSVNIENNRENNMKKYVISFLFLFLFSLYLPIELISAEANESSSELNNSSSKLNENSSKFNLFDACGINLGLNTFKLLGNLSSVQPQNAREENTRPGGGLAFIESGIDLSATFFIDTALQHRVIVGGEYIWMNAREVSSISPYLYYYSYHTVQFVDFYVGYHYVFWNAPFQDVKIYAGAEAMVNNITLNELDRGLIYMNFPQQNRTFLYTKESSTRLGARVRAGFEGRLHKQLYINASFTLGLYNLLLRENSTGELFNYRNSFETKESLQPFFNYLLSFQYRFK
jgi:hypothetical protein